MATAYIDPDGGSDYTSLSAWEATLAATLTEAEIAECRSLNASHTADTAQCVVNAHTTSATNYIEIRAAATDRHAGVWDNAKYRLSVGNVAGSGLQILVAHCRVRNLQIGKTANTSQTVECGTGTGGWVYVSGCILWVSSSNDYHIGAEGWQSGQTYYFHNNLVYTTTKGANSEGLRAFAGTCYLFNNTVQNFNVGITRPGGTCKAVNNLITGCTTAATGTYLAGSGYNATNNASMGYTVTGGAVGDRTSQTFTFQGSHPDYRLAATDGGARNYGADLSMDANLPFVEDALGNVRRYKAWDIGYYEYGATTDRILTRGVDPSGIFRGTPTRGVTAAATNTGTITIPSTTAGSTLVVWVTGANDLRVTSITATGATFTDRVNVSGVAWSSLFTAENVNGGITQLTANWTGYQAITYTVVELAGGAYDTATIRNNTYNVNDLGTGSITTGGSGVALAFFAEGYGAATNCATGTGWTAGTYDGTSDTFYEYRATSASTGYGGTSGQATGTGSGVDWNGAIINLTGLSIPTSDYTSLSAWESGRQGDLTARAVIEEALCKCEGANAAADGAVAIDSWTMSAAYYPSVIVDAASRHAGVWNSAKYRVVAASGADGSVVYAWTGNYVRFDGLQVQQTATGAASHGVWIDNAVDCRLSRCIIRGPNDAAANVHSGCRLRQGKVWNCIAYDWSGATNAHGFSKGGAGDAGVVWFYNCTAYHCGRGYEVPDDGYATHLFNCLAANCTDGFYAGWDFSDSDYCASDLAADITGAHSRNSQTFSFVNAAGGDFHLTGSDTGARTYGVTDPGSGLFSDDIDGDTRTAPWDIGADQYIASFNPLPIWAALHRGHLLSIRKER